MSRIYAPKGGRQYSARQVRKEDARNARYHAKRSLTAGKTEEREFYVLDDSGGLRHISTSRRPVPGLRPSKVPKMPTERTPAAVIKYMGKTILYYGERVAMVLILLKAGEMLLEHADHHHDGYAAAEDSDSQVDVHHIREEGRDLWDHHGKAIEDGIINESEAKQLAADAAVLHNDVERAKQPASYLAADTAAAHQVADKLYEAEKNNAGSNQAKQLADELEKDLQKVRSDTSAFKNADKPVFGEDPLTKETFGVGGPNDPDYAYWSVVSAENSIDNWKNGSPIDSPDSLQDATDYLAWAEHQGASYNAYISMLDSYLSALDAVLHDKPVCQNGKEQWWSPFTGQLRDSQLDVHVDALRAYRYMQGPGSELLTGSIPIDSQPHAFTDTLLGEKYEISMAPGPDNSMVDVNASDMKCETSYKVLVDIGSPISTSISRLPIAQGITATMRAIEITGVSPSKEASFKIRSFGYLGREWQPAPKPDGLNACKSDPIIPLAAVSPNPQTAHDSPQPSKHYATTVEPNYCLPAFFALAASMAAVSAARQLRQRMELRAALRELDREMEN